MGATPRKRVMVAHVTRRLPREYCCSVRIVATVGAVLVIALLPGSAKAQSEQELAFADDEPLVISVDSGDAIAFATVVVVNGGPEVNKLTFSAVSNSDDAPALDVEVEGSSAIAAGGAAPISLRFTANELLGSFDGHLIVSSGTAAAERDLKLNEKDPIPVGVNMIIFGSFALGAVLAVLRAGTLTDRLRWLLSAPGWDYSKSWASTFTVVGAVLGTILASLALPEAPDRFSKSTLAGMNLIFAAAILVAPFLFSVTEKPRSVKDTDGVPRTKGQGTVAGYLMACGLTLGAVVGQLITVYFLLDEIRANGALPDESLVFLLGLLGVVIVLVVLYAWRTMGWVAQNASDPSASPPEGDTAGVAGLPEAAVSPPLL